MAYLLRFVQRFRPESKEEFLALEREFIKLESVNPGLPQGRRYLPFAGREPAHTLIWECEFETLEALNKAFSALEADSLHDKLYRRQVPFFLEAYTEIYERFS